jgi:hypothetical protein
MATQAITGLASSGLPVGKPVKLVSQIVDFSSTTHTSADVIQAIEVPANTLCLYAGFDILTADGAGNSGTLSLGDGADVDAFVTAQTVASVGLGVTRAQAGASSMGTTSIGFRVYAAADTIDLVVATGVIDAKIRVFAVLCDIDGEGDSEAQKSTFA